MAGSKLSVVGLDAFPLAPALPPGFASLPPADFKVEEWEVRRPCHLPCLGCRILFWGCGAGMGCGGAHRF